VNITRKYRVESFATTSKIIGILSPGVLEVTVKKMINKNARKSGFGRVSAIQWIWDKSHAP
jgi:hypothetical protein